MKLCKTCHQEKPVQAFTYSRRHADGYFPSCRTCKNGSGSYYQRNRDRLIEAQRQHYRQNRSAALAYHRKRKYGVSDEWYQAKLLEQENACAVCGYVPPPDKRSLSLDHDHKTGEPRSLLCYACNSALGYAFDSIQRLEALVDYLRTHGD